MQHKVPMMDSGFFENWTTQIRKGLLEFCVLSALSGERLYGYDIVRRLRQVEGLVISEGTIYPILSRLRRDGLVRTRLEESNEGPARKYYELTEPGRRTLERMNGMWRQILQGVQGLQSEPERREE
jgi:PadR family transcriptional regulator PadR